MSSTFDPEIATRWPRWRASPRRRWAMSRVGAPPGSPSSPRAQPSPCPGKVEGAAATFLGNDILRVEDGRFVEYRVGSMVAT